MASSISFTRWGSAAVLTAVVLSALLMVSSIGALIGVRVAPGLPFGNIRIGDNNSRILYRDETAPVEWDLNPPNATQYPGEMFTLCPPSVKGLHRSCLVLATYVPNTGQATVFVPPDAPLGVGVFIMQAWRANEADFIAMGPATMVLVRVQDRAVATFSPSPPSPNPSPLAVASPSPTPLPTPLLPTPSPSPSPSPTSATFIPAQVTLLEPLPTTVVPPGVSALSVRVQRFLGTAPGWVCERWSLQHPDGTITTLTAADWLQAPAILAPPCS